MITALHTAWTKAFVSPTQRRISPVLKRLRRWRKKGEEREKKVAIYTFTFSFDEANCVAWKPGRRKDRRESESTHIDEPSAVVIVMQLLFKWYRDLPRLLTREGRPEGSTCWTNFIRNRSSYYLDLSIAENGIEIHFSRCLRWIKNLRNDANGIN